MTQSGPFKCEIILWKLLYEARQVSENVHLILLRRTRKIFISYLSKLFTLPDVSLSLPTTLSKGLGGGGGGVSGPCRLLAHEPFALRILNWMGVKSIF